MIILDLTPLIERLTSAFVLLGIMAGALIDAHVLMNLLARRKTAAFKHTQPVSTLPLLGNILNATVFHSDRTYDWITEQCEAFGNRPWLLSIPGSVPSLFISAPELDEGVLKTQFYSFQKEEDGTHYFTDFFGKSMLTSDGDKWAFHRKTASHLFSQQMLRDVMYETVREKIQTFCDVLKVYEARDQSTVSFKSVMSHFTGDVFGKIGFGVELNCLENGVTGKKGNEFIDAFAASTAVIFLQFMQSVWLWRLKRYLKLGVEGKNIEYIKVINAFIHRVVSESIERKSNLNSELGTSTAAPPPKDLISLILNISMKDLENLKGKAYDSEMQLVRDTVVNFIFAGKDTTANSMSFFIVMTNRYPAVLVKIRDELRKKLPRSPSGEFLIPSMDDLVQLIYLEAAIRENLRLNLIVPITPRQAKEDLVLCDVGLGDDALEFKPERWIAPTTGKLVAVSPYKFISFFAGPRQCMGIKFAMVETECALVVLLSKFDFTTVEDPWEITYEPVMDLTVKGR